MYNKKLQVPRDGASNTRLIPQSSCCSPKSEASQRESISQSQLSAHIDTLSIKGVLPSKKKFEAMVGFIASATDQPVQYKFSESPFYDGGNEIFSNKIQMTHGCSGGFTVNEVDGSVTWCIKLLGSYFENISLINSWRLIRGLKNEYKVDCTRIDPAIDDPTFKLIPINEMVEADENGQRMFYKKYKLVKERNHLGKYYATHYFGSRQSGKMVRVYNHDDECLRLETEFKRQYARKIFDTIASIERTENLEQELMKLIAGLAVGAIDFRDTTVRQDVQKASMKDTKRLDFWQKFIDLVGQELRVKLPKVIRTVAKTTDWLNHQISPTLSALKDGMGRARFNRFLDEILYQGSKRYAVKHELLIETVKCGLNEVPSSKRKAREVGLIC